MSKLFFFLHDPVFWILISIFIGLLGVMLYIVSKDK